MAQKNRKRILPGLDLSVQGVVVGIYKCLEKLLVPIFSFVLDRGKWKLGLICSLLFLTIGCCICRHSNYPVSVFAFVFLSFCAISWVSIFAEQHFLKAIKTVERHILGHSASYDHNAEIGTLVATAKNKWLLSGAMVFKIIGTVAFFGILGCILLGNQPPMSVLILFLCLYAVAVSFSMIGYHQYEALLSFVHALSEKYEPTKKTIRWMTKEETAWLTELAQLYDFMSAAFFVLSLLFIVACFGFCFLPAFGVRSGKNLFLDLVLLIFWGKIGYELAAKYPYRLYKGKQALNAIADRIKISHLEQIQSSFHDPINAEKDYTGYGLYLQLQSLQIVPKMNAVASLVRGICSAASFCVTLSSLCTILQTLQAQLP